MVFNVQGCYLQNGELKSSKDFDETKVMSAVNVYEVLRVIDGIPLFYEKHVHRMKKSMALINKEFNYSEETFLNNMLKLIDANDKVNGNIKIVINADKDEENITLYYIPHHYPKDEEYKKGVKTILYKGERDNPNAKIVNDNFRQKVNRKIEEEGAYEAILVDNAGYITEGSRSNIFMVKEDTLLTSPVETVLPGVTREVILELCRENDLKIVEEKINAEEIIYMDGAFISGTSPKILPISEIDNIEYNSPNNYIINKLMNLYEYKIQKYTEYSRKHIYLK